MTPPVTVARTAVAVRQLGSTRRSLAGCAPAAPPEVLGRSVEIPDLGVMMTAEWTPLIIGHLTGHVDQP